jgi:hypothetical protein
MDAGKLRADITRALGANVHKPYLHGVVRTLMAIAEKHADELADEAVAALRGNRETALAPVQVELSFTGTDSQFTRWLQENAGRLGTRAMIGYAEAAEATRWVLVEGYHDSGTINGVYGPYTEAYIDWLLAAPLQYHSGNWTKVKLSDGPEETDGS